MMKDSNNTHKKQPKTTQKIEQIDKNKTPQIKNKSTTQQYTKNKKIKK